VALTSALARKLTLRSTEVWSVVKAGIVAAGYTCPLDSFLKRGPRTKGSREEPVDPAWICLAEDPRALQPLSDVCGSIGVVANAIKTKLAAARTALVSSGSTRVLLGVLRPPQGQRRVRTDVLCRRRERRPRAHTRQERETPFKELPKRLRHCTQDL